MAEKFAFESEEVSIAFSLINGLGDCVMIKKVYDALTELAPSCRIDIFCDKELHKTFAKSFYGDSKNLNLILNRDALYNTLAPKYDLALCVAGCHAIILESGNAARLHAMSPKLLESVAKIDEYNKRNLYAVGPAGTSVAFRNMMTAGILNKNFSWFLSCGGALPILDDVIKIPLAPEYKSQFDELKLGKYITIYTDIAESEKNRPKVKTWSVRYWHEYVARVKKNFPKLTVIQCGGGDIPIENADRHFLGCDLELTKYILSNSLLHVGCEGGLIHLATALGTKCLVLFGSSSADYFGYNRNINLVSEICRPCMYIVPDFQVCIRGAKEPPCMLSHTPQLVCEITCNYLKNNA